MGRRSPGKQQTTRFGMSGARPCTPSRPQARPLVRPARDAVRSAESAARLADSESPLHVSPDQ